MISNYNLDCDYHNFELKDKIYLIPESALKIIYTDGYNEAVFTGDDSNVTILEGYDISFQEESSFDERFKFSRTLSIKVDGYKTFNDINYRYMVIIETKDGEFYIVNSDFQSFVTHTYTLTNGINSTEFVFSSQSNIPTIKLTGFEPNNVNSCKVYNIPKIRKIKLADLNSDDSSISTWKRYLINRGVFANVEPLPDSVSLQEEFDGEKYTVTLGFDIPMNYFKNDWHIKLLQFDENKYRGYVQLEDGNIAFVGYNTGLFPSYTINGDIISIRLTETSIRGISYGNDYAVIDTDMPSSIEFSGATCKNYNFESTCNWNVESKPDFITVSPISGQAYTQYVLTICNTEAEVYKESQFVIRSCNTTIATNVVAKNEMYRWQKTDETICKELIGGKFKLTLNDSSTVSAECGVSNAITQYEISRPYKETLVSAVIGDCATDINKSAFEGCTGLTSIDIPDNVTSIGDEAFQYCSGLTSVTIGTGVTSIGAYAFHNCSGLTNINLPDSVTSIGNYVFFDCSGLTYVNIPRGITSISHGFFANCYSLTGATIPNNVRNIGSSAFWQCLSLTSIGPTGSGASLEIPNSVTSIGKDAFLGCDSLTSATIPNSVTLIGGSAFAACGSLTSIGPNGSGASLEIPTGVTAIADYVFYGCTGVTSVTIPDSVTSIGEYSISSCVYLTSCTIGSGVTSIGERAFHYSRRLPSIDIPDNVTTIGASAFTQCSGLTSCTIGSGVTSIGERAFEKCSRLESITCFATTPPVLGNYAFKETDACPIYVPNGSVNAYKAASGWSDYESRIQAIP